MSEHLFATYPTLFETHCNSPLPPAIDAESSVPDYVLEICQQPRYTRVSLGKENGAYICTQRGPQQSATWKLYPRDYLVKRADETTADRKPIDPPPILQLQVSQRKDPWQNFLQSPYYFVTCALLKGDEAAEKSPMPNHLTGTVVSSLHRLKDLNNRDGAFFVFGDLGCKTEGKFRLRFTLYQMQKLECVQLVSTVSDAFQVYSPKLFPGLAQSTDLTRSFSDQGVRLRLRKALWGVPTRKRNTAAAGLFWEAPESHDQRRSKRKARTEDVFAHGVDGSAFDLQAHPTAAEYDCFSPPPQRMATKRRRLASDAFPPPSSYYSLESISTSTADLAYYNQPRAMEYYSMTTPVTSASYDYPDRAASLPMAQQLDRLVTEPHDGQHGGPGMSRRDDAFQKSLIAYPPQTAFPYSTLQAPPSSMGLNQYFDSPICSQNLAEDSSERYQPHPGLLHMSDVSAGTTRPMRMKHRQNRLSSSTETTMTTTDVAASYAPAAATTAATAPLPRHYSYVQTRGESPLHLLATAPDMYPVRAASGLLPLDLQCPQWWYKSWTWIRYQSL